jgi:hypothetical protein
VIVPILGVALAASFVWLVIRLINRRERWAKRLAAALVAMLVAYLLSFGPIARLESRGGWSQSQETAFEVLYFPFFCGVNFGPQWIRSPLYWYLNLWGVE